jgi:hypothetical protein
MITVLIAIAFCIGLIWLCLRDRQMRIAVLIFVGIIVLACAIVATAIFAS